MEVLALCIFPMLIDSFPILLDTSRRLLAKVLIVVEEEVVEAGDTVIVVLPGFLSLFQSLFALRDSRQQTKAFLFLHTSNHDDHYVKGS